MGGKHLVTTCTLSKNGYSVSTKALIDCGANGFIFIDTLCAADIAQYLGLKTRRLPQPAAVKGYDGKSENAITHFLLLHLTVDGRRFYNTPLLILDLGSHDLILGRKWLASFKILVDCHNHCLHWPSHLQPSHSVVREITVPRQGLLPQRTLRNYQEDADARDQAFEEEEDLVGAFVTLLELVADLHELQQGHHVLVVLQPSNGVAILGTRSRFDKLSHQRVDRHDDEEERVVGAEP